MFVWLSKFDKKVLRNQGLLLFEGQRQMPLKRDVYLELVLKGRAKRTDNTLR